MVAKEERRVGLLYIADSYNHKIKLLDATTARTISLLGDGTPALRDGPGASASFWEPGGLDIADGRLYVADTNNHAIRIVELSGLRVTTLRFQGLVP